tara:strand:+ start:284 stop:922 length:639 start_codon:yes stop_codon:yes gene_type:complete
MANPLTDLWNAIFGGGGGSDTPEYESAAEAEARRQLKVDAGLREIEKVFEQYDQDFYDKSQDAYLDYYEPQLEDQYKKGLRDLKFALARGGRFGSSTEVDKKAKAAQDLGFQKSELASGAIEAADKSQAAVNAAKKDLTQLNQMNANPQLAASLAQSQAGILNQPQKYDQLLDVFGNITEGLAKREEIENRRKIRDRIQLWEQGKGSGSVVG